MTGRQRAVAFFITLGVCLVAVAITLNVSWILIHWRRAVPLVLGVILFAIIIAGLIVYTIFLVREIYRNEQHDSFINAVTHELKTPVTSIRLYLETLQSREVSEEKRREFYKVMLDDTNRLLYTVEQVLKAGVAGQKRHKHAEMMVELSGVVGECVELAKLRHHLPAEAVLWNSSNGLGANVLGDPEELRTAISNLLDNAVKYSDGDVKVRVDLQPANENRIQLRITDNGVGIPRNQLKLVFKRFYRVPARAVRQVKGTGLGLFIVRSIAKKHGGRVFAESDGEGKGSIFTLELPIA